MRSGQLHPHRLVVGAVRVSVDADGLHLRCKVGLYEDVVDEAGFFRMGRVAPGDRSVRDATRQRIGVDRVMGDDLGTLNRIGRTGHDQVLGRALYHVEVAHQHEFLRAGEFWESVFGSACYGAAFHCKGVDPLLEMTDLRDPFLLTDMVDMHRIDAQRPGGCHDKRFQRRALQVAAADAPAARQKQIAGGHDRPARQHHVAELQALVCRLSIVAEHAEVDVHGDAVDVEKVGQQFCQPVDHIGHVVAHEVAGHFLQRDDVGAVKGAGNALEVVAPVAADAVLRVVGDQLHPVRLPMPHGIRANPLSPFAAPCAMAEAPQQRNKQ